MKTPMKNQPRETAEEGEARTKIKKKMKKKRMTSTSVKPPNEDVQFKSWERARNRFVKLEVIEYNSEKQSRDEARLPQLRTL